MLLEIGFIEEMKTNRGNKELRQVFLTNCPFLRKYYLLHLTQY